MKVVFMALYMIMLAGHLGGCSDPKPRALQGPVAFHGDDECHICGMTISHFPGPKGQAIREQQVYKFCSSSEMLGWYLQPENQTRQVQLFVHDMGQSPWEAPKNEHLVDARTAYFVLAPHLPGAMGVPLASFAEEEDARHFAEQYQKQTMKLDDITPAILRHKPFPAIHNEE